MKVKCQFGSVGCNARQGRWKIISSKTYVCLYTASVCMWVGPSLDENVLFWCIHLLLNTICFTFAHIYPLLKNSNVGKIIIFHRQTSTQLTCGFRWVNRASSLSPSLFGMSICCGWELKFTFLSPSFPHRRAHTQSHTQLYLNWDAANPWSESAKNAGYTYIFRGII